MATLIGCGVITNQVAVPASTPYATAVGAQPVITSLLWKYWYSTLLQWRQNECPRSRATRYYVSNSGSDSNAGTSTAAPWLTPMRVQAFLNSNPTGVEISFRDGDIYRYWSTPAITITAETGTTATITNSTSTNTHLLAGAAINLLAGGTGNTSAETASISSYVSGTGVLTWAAATTNTNYKALTDGPYAAISASGTNSITSPAAGAALYSWYPGMTVWLVGPNGVESKVVQKYDPANYIATFTANLTYSGPTFVTFQQPFSPTTVSGNVTLDDYANNVSPGSLPTPLFSAFGYQSSATYTDHTGHQQYTAASFSQSIGQANATTYPNVWAFADTNPVVWIREADDDEFIYFSADSMTHCNAVAGSFYIDPVGGFVYIHPRDNSNPTTSGSFYEPVYANCGSGPTIGNANNVAVDGSAFYNLEADGFGMGSISNGHYGFTLRPAGTTQANLIYGCRAFYCGNHCIGMLGNGNTTPYGCIGTAINCVAGAMWVSNASVQSPGTAFVGYNLNAGQEWILHNSLVTSGQLPNTYIFNTLAFTGSPTAGTFNINYGGQAAAVTYSTSLTAASLQSTLQAAWTSATQPTNITVIGSNGGPFQISLGYANAQTAVTLSSIALSGGSSPSANITAGSTYIEPYAGSTNLGSCNLAHGNGTLSLFVEYGVSNMPGPYQVSEIGSSAAGPTFTDLKNCTVSMVNCHFHARYPNATDLAYSGTRTYVPLTDGFPSGSGSSANSVCVNSSFEGRILYSGPNTNNLSLHLGSTQPIAINCTFLWDFTQAPSSGVTSNNTCYRCATASASTTQEHAEIGEYYNCWFTFLGVGRANYAWDSGVADTNNTTNFLGPATPGTIGQNFKIKNSILEMRSGMSQFLSAPGISVGIGNNIAGQVTDELVNNCYVGFNSARRSGTRGYDQDPDLLEMASLPQGEEFDASNALFSTTPQTIGGYTLQYDARFRPRNNPAGDWIGPYIDINAAPVSFANRRIIQ